MGSQVLFLVASDFMGLIDNLQIAASGLEPGKTYKLVLVGGPHPQDLVAFTTGIGGAAVAQTLGPLKRAIAESSNEHATTLEVRSAGGDVILQQTKSSQVRQ